MVKESDLFNNEFYFKEYPDVLAAVNNGIFKSGYDHFIKHGKKEGRKHEFKPVLDYEIDQVNPGWSNHLTLKGWKEPEQKEIVLNIELVQDEFKPVQLVEYPIGNKLPFERYFEHKFNEIKPDTFRTYLPVHWCAYYVNNGYKSTKQFQQFINSLDKSKSYFTICQYDDGILDNIEGLDLLVYSMGCNKPGYYPIPLISQPLNNSPQETVIKDIHHSFIGANTHPIREQLINEFKDEYVYFGSTPDYYDILKRSIFALCPRGYGVTSFRMFEAMAFNCIPVYISDKFWEPLNLPFDYGIKILPEQIKDLHEILSKVDIKVMQAKVKEVYENYFVYSQCFESIIKTLTI